MKKEIVLMGGGHGLSNIVKGFKNEEIELSVVVSSTDDGGHTGKIRDEFDFIAVGDLRMVINELLDKDSVLKEFFNYRFCLLHGIKNVSLGNLIIVSLIDKYKDIDKVIKYFKEKEKIKSNVYLSSNNSLTLCAKCKNEKIIKCEHKIGVSNEKINKLFVDKEALCNEEMLKKIEKSSLIVLCPGSLYTSVGSVLCIDKIKKAIRNSKASIVYVCNIMTQNGETSGYTVNNHVEELEKIMGKSIDRVIVNNGDVNEEVLDKYKEENSYLVKCDERKSNYEFHDLVEIFDGRIRHNSNLVKKIILDQ